MIFILHMHVTLIVCCIFLYKVYHEKENLTEPLCENNETYKICDTA